MKYGDIKLLKTNNVVFKMLLINVYQNRMTIQLIRI